MPEDTARPMPPAAIRDGEVTIYGKLEIEQDLVPADDPRFSRPPEDTARPAFIAENWQTSTTSPVFHVTHPDGRDAWCGQRWTDSSFIGVANSRARRCRRCQYLGAGE